MQLFALPTETVGRSSRRIVVNGDELRAEKLAAGDLVRVSAYGRIEPFIFLQAWPTVTNPASFAQLSPSHLLTLGLPSHDPDDSPDAPLASITLTKVRMAKAGMRDARLVGVTEVLLSAEVQGGKKEEQEVELEEKERENAWVRVCLREALVDLKYLTPHTHLIVPLPSSSSTRTFRISSIDDTVFPPTPTSTSTDASLSSGLEALKIDGEDDSKSVWQATWSTEVLVTLGSGKGKGKAGAASKERERTKTGGGASTSSTSKPTLPSYINIYPPPPAPNPLNPLPLSGYSLLGGLTTQISLIRSMIDLPLLHPLLFRSLSLPPPRGILLHGPPGTGKTALARAIATSSPGCSCIVINGPELSSSFHGETEERLRGVWEEARRRSPCVIVIDEIDALCPKREEGGGEVERRVVAQVLTLMDGMGMGGGGGGEGEGEEEARVVVVGATNRPNAIDPALRRPGRFDKEIEIGVPDAPSRLQILEILLAPIPNTLSPTSLSLIASKTHGYVGADLSSLIREAGTLAIQAHLSSLTFNLTTPAPSLVLSEADLVAALEMVRPSAMREVFLETPSTKWSDIGGQEDVKQKLRECVEWPLLYKDTFERLGVRPPRGVLLYGPPGCSKTLTAKALATESGINFLAVKGPELLNKYVGESERAVREVFRKARAASPSIIFFDEIDALCTSRSDGDSHTDGILTSILNEMDGIEELVGVTVVAATNRPDVIDSAMLRPGRIDRILYVGPPSLESRAEIFKIRLAQMAVEPGVDVNELAAMTDGCSGAEIVQVCQDAALLAMNFDLNAPFVRRSDFLTAVSTVGRRITPEMVSFFESWRDGSGARSA